MLLFKFILLFYTQDSRDPHSRYYSDCHLISGCANLPTRATTDNTNPKKCARLPGTDYRLLRSSPPADRRKTKRGPRIIRKQSPGTRIRGTTQTATREQAAPTRRRGRIKIIAQIGCGVSRSCFGQQLSWMEGRCVSIR